jgi:hypothetical protein
MEQFKIVVREKTRKEKHDDEVTATLILGSLAACAGFGFLMWLLITLMAR